MAFDRVEPLLKMFRLDQKLDWFPVHFLKRDEAEGHDYLCFCRRSGVFSSLMSLFLASIRWPFLRLIQLLESGKAKGKSILMRYPRAGFGGEDV